MSLDPALRRCSRCGTPFYIGEGYTRQWWRRVCSECQPPVVPQPPDVVELMERNHDRFPRASRRTGAMDWS